MLPDILRQLGASPILPRLLAQRQRYSNRVAPGRLEYSFFEFVIGAALLLGLTFAALALARRYRTERDERLTAQAGGWRVRSQLDFDPGDPFNRFPGLGLAMPQNVMEGQEEGFDVAYFEANVGRRQPSVPHALVQLPVEPPRERYVADDGGVVGSGWGPRASQLLATASGVVVETAPLAVLVRSSGASSDAVSRFALALARAVVDDAKAPV